MDLLVISFNNSNKLNFFSYFITNFKHLVISKVLDTCISGGLSAILIKGDYVYYFLFTFLHGVSLPKTSLF